MIESIQAEIINLLMAIIVACVGAVTRKVVKFLNEKTIISKLESNREIVRIVVDAIEQVYIELDGEQKFNIAKQEVIKIMNEKGIKITDLEINSLIESVVKEMNDSFK